MTTPNNDARGNILSRLKAVSEQPWHKNWPLEVPAGAVFPSVSDLLSQFREELVQVGGKVVEAHGREALFLEFKKLCEANGWVQPVTLNAALYDEMQNAGIKCTNRADFDSDFEVGVTTCEALVALTGGVMVSSAGTSGRKMNVFPPVHVVVAGKRQIVPSIVDGFKEIEKRYPQAKPSQVTLISGPSRTADIEKTLVMGAHGPRELVVLIDLET